jgi:hypothetical protein
MMHLQRHVLPLTLERGPLPAQAFHRLVLNATAPFS